MAKKEKLKSKTKVTKKKRSTPARPKEAKFEQELLRLKRQAFVAERIRFEKARDSGRQAKNQMALLAAGVGHEFNNILGAIDGHAEWALSTGTLEDMTEALQVARVACARSAQITRALQGLAQADEESYELVDAGAFFDEIKRLVSAELKLSAIQFTAENSLSKAIIFYGSRSRLMEVLVNLVRNAMDELVSLEAHGEKRLHLSLVASKKNLIFSVEDSGQGVDKNISELIFQPFFTTKGVLKAMKIESAGSPDKSLSKPEATLPEKTSAHGGSGLGLYLSRAIAEDHGGTLELTYAEKLKGARFELSLPIAAKR